jgi:hypothetical protein
VLRLLALSRSVDDYDNPMKEFLNHAMLRNKSGRSTKVKRFVKLFPKASRLLVDSLGEKPFHIRGPLNVSVLDSVFCTVLDHLDRIPKDFKKRYQALISDKRFGDHTRKSTTDATRLKERFALAKQHLV